MKITNIDVSAGRTFNHPYESYSNFRFDLSLRAELGPDDDPGEVLRVLQAQAESAAEQHKRTLLKDVEHLHEAQRLDEELRSMEQRLRTAQQAFREAKIRRGEIQLERVAMLEAPDLVNQ